MYKESKFNSFYPTEDEGKILAFNALTGALALMKEDDFIKYENMKALDFKNLNEAEKELANNMKKGGYLIDESINELDIIKYNQNKGKYNTKSLGLTIAPTLGCNFRCVYCYQKDHENYSKMSSDIQNKLLDFVKSEIHNINSLNITWFGGEPLLAMDVIENLSLEFINLCKEKDVNYSAGMITNGYLLNKETAKKLKDLNVNYMQVTLDGCEKTHNEKRFLAGNQPTFRNILKNLEEIKDDFSNISIRVNTDKNNKDDVFKLFDSLKEYNILESFIPYLAYVEPINNTYEKDNCLNFEDFCEIQRNFSKEVSNFSKDKNIMTKYPSPKLNFCGADALNSYVIDSNGKLYKCWSDIGRDEYCIGNLNDGIQNIAQVLQYATYEVTEDEKCIDCKILPLCVGGCPRRRIDGVVDRCSDLKFGLEKYLKDVMIFKKNNKTQDTSTNCQGCM